ncbi:MAG: histidine phosphatase family protein [Actinobacteria bacterium]|nr:histidine phosphatase family protein [Actinomycetota bacterium]
MQLVAVRRALSQDSNNHRLLTREGLIQAQKTARALGDQFPHANRLLTSPSLRAVQTATLIGDRLGMAPEEFEPIDEVVPPPEEDREEFLRAAYPRCIGAFREIVNQHEGVVIAVTHRRVLSAYLALFWGFENPRDAWVRAIARRTGWELDVPPASITVIDVNGEGRPSLLRVGDLSHLA